MIDSARITPETIQFLKNLQDNNSKSWFEVHRKEYEDFLLEPLKYIVEELGPIMLTIDTLLEVRPAVGKTISRIYRDVRFARDKSPFRSAMWITFKRPVQDWQDAPAFFFEIAMESYRYGMGYYCASKATMDRLRENIIKHPDELIELAQSTFKHGFVLEGEEYKKEKQTNIPGELRSWSRRKNIFLVSNHTIGQRLYGEALIRDLVSGFTSLAPLYHYFWGLKGS